MSIETPRLPHLPSVQALRGVAALGVLLSHLYVIEAKYSPDALLGPWARLGMAGVDLFFVISGFIMVYVTWGRDVRPGAFLWRRVTRIYPLYWIVSAALLAVWLVRPDMVFASNPDPDIVRSFLLLPQDGEPLLAVGWTLIYEMYFYLVFATLLILPRTWVLPAIGIWGIVFASVGMLMQTTSPTLRLLTSPLLLEFISGAVLAHIYLRFGDRRYVGFVGLIILSLAAVLSFGALDSILADDRLRVVGFGTMALGAFLAVQFDKAVSPAGVAQWLGDISYSLYLTHVLTLSLVGRLAAPWLRDGWVDNIVLLAVLVAASLLVAHVTYVLIERPLIRFFRRRRSPAAASA